MFNLLSHRFIKDATNYTDASVRQQYGTLCSIVSILCNIILVVFKITIGIFTNSIAIMADGFNNLSDVGSNFASLFGFKLANKHPDIDHPYGHGRMEYIAGLIISFLIILVGLQTLKDSVMKVINPEQVTFNILACVILGISILIKLWMFKFNCQIGKLINSSTLIAAGQDSINDVFTTAATLVSLLLSLVTDLPVDGVFGALMALIVLKAGYSVFIDTLDPLLGKAPDKKLVKEIEDFIVSYPATLGIHDVMFHDYGPGRKFMTLHVEVDGNDDIMFVHDEIDQIERAVLKKFQILTTIHMDPIDTNDPLTEELKDMVDKIVKDINQNYSIHDFRFISGPTRTNLIFDVLLPAQDEIDHKQLKQDITAKIKAVNENYFTIIQIDHCFV